MDLNLYAVLVFAAFVLVMVAWGVGERSITLVALSVVVVALLVGLIR